MILSRACLLALILLLAVAPLRAKAGAPSSVESELKLNEGDEAGNDIKALKVEILVSKSEKNAIAQLKLLLKKHKGSQMEPELLARMAELYMRRARTERFFEVHRGQNEIMRLAPALVQGASEKLEIGQAISIYADIEKRFPKFRNTDVVLFNSAYAYQQLGKYELGQTQFLKLLSREPKSPLVPDALLALGEINYQQHKFEVAISYFEKIRKHPTSHVYPYGIYKTAWSFYNLQQAKAAIQQLEDVIAFGKEVAQKHLDAKLDLRREALSDLTLFYADVHDAKGMYAYFAEKSAPLDPTPYILKAVDIFDRHSRYNDVETVLSDLITAKGPSQSSAQAYRARINNSEKSKSRKLAMEHLLSLEAMCKEISSLGPSARTVTHAEANEGAKADKKQTQTCEQLLVETSRALAVRWHAIWKKNPASDKSLGEAAETAYEIAIRTSKTPEAEIGKIRFEFAELLFASAKYWPAVAQYQAAYKSPGLTNDEQHRSLYGALVSLDHAKTDSWTDADLSLLEKLNAQYHTQFPAGPYLLEIDFKLGFVHYERKELKEAAVHFHKIGWETKATPEQQQNSSEKITKSQDLYLDILNTQKDFAALRVATQELLQKGAAEDRGQGLQKIYREAYFSELQLLEEKGELPKAIRGYLLFAKEQKGTELGAKAVWNASQLMIKTKQSRLSAQTCEVLAQEYPKSPHALDCLRLAAGVYESLAHLDLASSVLLKMSVVPENAQAAKNRETAADFLAIDGQLVPAMKIYRELVQNEKVSAEKARLQTKIHDLTRMQSGIATADVALNVEPFASERVVASAEESLQKMRFTDAFNTAKKIIAQDALPKEFLARARFVQAQVLEDEFRRQSIKSRAERLSLVISLKAEKLDKAQKAYQSAIRYGDPKVSVLALQRLGECYLGFAQSLKTLELTSDGAPLAAAEEKALRAEIEKMSVPMEEKGIESLNQALEASRRLALYDGTSVALQIRLNGLNMGSPLPQPKPAQHRVVVPQFNTNVHSPKSIQKTAEYNHE